MKKNRHLSGVVETKSIDGRQVKGIFNGSELVREVKSLPFFVSDIQDDRTVTGIFSVFGNLDEIKDRVHPGAFTKTMSEGRKRFKFLWQHDFSLPPVAHIKSVRELTRAELPASVLESAPDATGGAEVTRVYFENDFANWVYQGIKTGAVDEMSFGYDTIKYEIDEESKADNGWPIRELKELRLWDISDVIHGCNPATVASKTTDTLAEFMDLIQTEEITETNLDRFKALYDKLKNHFEAAEPPPATTPQVTPHSLIDDIDIALLELENI
jgi:HK97 family phage prohead protease